VVGIDVSAIVYEGVPTVEGTFSEKDSRTYIAKFNKQDLMDVPTGDAVILRVIVEVRYNGDLFNFVGSDTIG
jgi:hypothetical protein